MEHPLKAKYTNGVANYFFLENSRVFTSYPTVSKAADVREICLNQFVQRLSWRGHCDTPGACLAQVGRQPTEEQLGSHWPLLPGLLGAPPVADVTGMWSVPCPVRKLPVDSKEDHRDHSKI